MSTAGCTPRRGPLSWVVLVATGCGLVPLSHDPNRHQVGAFGNVTTTFEPVAEPFRRGSSELPQVVGGPPSGSAELGDLTVQSHDEQAARVAARERGAHYVQRLVVHPAGISVWRLYRRSRPIPGAPPEWPAANTGAALRIDCEVLQIWFDEPVPLARTFARAWFSRPGKPVRRLVLPQLHGDLDLSTSGVPAAAKRQTLLVSFGEVRAWFTPLNRTRTRLSARAELRLVLMAGEGDAGEAGTVVEQTDAVMNTPEAEREPALLAGAKRIVEQRLIDRFVAAYRERAN